MRKIYLLLPALLLCFCDAQARKTKSEEDHSTLMRRLSMLALDVTAFDNAIESIVNMAEVWRKMLDDFRPAAKTTTETFCKF